jgi:hypothetical protein
MKIYYDVLCMIKIIIFWDCGFVDDITNFEL